jgi:hypothetical protein
MAATVLNSPRAVAMSIYVVRAFIKMRKELLANSTLEKRLAIIKKTLIGHCATSIKRSARYFCRRRRNQSAKADSIKEAGCPSAASLW